MSTKKEVLREYTFADSQLKQNADSIRNKIDRDHEQFATRGLTPAVISNFQGLIDAFDNTTTDEELLGTLSEATLAKDTLGENFRVSIRTIRTMAENKWTSNHPSYRSFAFDGMNQMSDAELIRMGRRVVRKATEKLAELASEGLTVDMLEAMEQTRVDFDNSIDVLEDAICNRDEETQDRIIKGNALYREMMRLSNTGKDLFKSTDEAKYNDYVIYNTPSGENPPPDPNTGLIVQVLVNGTSEPVVNATIETNKKRGGTELTKSVKLTDATGAATFPGLEVVEYTYKVTRDGFVEQSGSAEVEAGVLKEVKVMLVAR